MAKSKELSQATAAASLALHQSGGRTVEGLDLPVPTAGMDAHQRAVALAQSRAAAATAALVTQKVVAVADVGRENSVPIQMGDYVKEAFLANDVKGVKKGDKLEVRKNGGSWQVVTNLSYRPPSVVAPAPSTANPGTASTVSGSAVQTLTGVPTAPRSSSGTTVSGHTEFLTHVRAHLIRLETWTINAQDRISELRNQMNSVRPAVNNHATSINSVRTVATSARDVAASTRLGLIDSGIMAAS